jgi:anaerobic dimethyl sulfoxide reductase subunit C (anchor subunit)
MNVREWALITFTILAQMSVGAFLILRVVNLYATKKANAAEADRFSDLTTLATIGVLGLGLLASLFHLGNPLSSPRAITNVASSWLSREIAFGCGFAVFGALYAIMQWFKVGSATLRNILAWVAALIGIGLITSMSVAYMLPTQPAWDNVATPVSFFTTSLLLGSLALGVAFYVNFNIIKGKNPGSVEIQSSLLRDVLSGLALLAMVMVGIEFVVIPLYLGSLAQQGGVAVNTIQMLMGSLNTAFVLRLVFAFLGAGVIGAFLFNFAKQGKQISRLGMLACSAFVLVLTAEVLGRVLFYSTHFRIGLY